MCSGENSVPTWPFHCFDKSILTIDRSPELTAVTPRPSVKNTPDGSILESRAPTTPVALRPVSASHAPAVVSAPGAQFRKNLWHLRNYRPELDFWECRKSFRNWAPGDGGGAGMAGGNFSQWGPPDTGVAITNITFPYVAPKNGYVVFNVGVLGSDLDTEVFINGMRVYYETSHNPSSNGEQDIIPVAKGDTVTLRVAGSENPGLNDVRGKCYFLPCSFSYSSLSIPLILYLGRQA